MPATQVIIPQAIYALGETASPAIAVPSAVNSASLDMDCSLWLLAATIEVVVEVSYDNGVTWQHAVSVTQNGPPPWNLAGGGTTTHLIFGVDYGNDPDTGLPATISPTHVRVRGVVTGNALTLGPGTLTVS